MTYGIFFFTPNSSCRIRTQGARTDGPSSWARGVAVGARAPPAREQLVGERALVLGRERVVHVVEHVRVGVDVEGLVERDVLKVPVGDGGELRVEEVAPPRRADVAQRAVRVGDGVVDEVTRAVDVAEREVLNQVRVAPRRRGARALERARTSVPINSIPFHSIAPRGNARSRRARRRRRPARARRRRARAASATRRRWSRARRRSRPRARPGRG